MRGRPPLSVVIPTRDRPEMLRGCLRALVAVLSREDDVVVVDSASSDQPAVCSVAAEFDVKLHRADRPGASRARNLGWRAAGHENIAFVDDDVQVAVGWPDAIATALAEHPTVGFVTGRIEVPQGQVARLPVSIKDSTEPVWLDHATAGLFGHSASMAARRAALEEVAGFDEQMGAGARFRAAEDADLFDRLLVAGWRGRYEPAARAWHDQWRKQRELVRLDFGYGMGSGARLAKLVRIDRVRLGVVAKEQLWRWGLAQLPPAVRAREKLLLAATLARLAGVAAGVVTGFAVPVVGGHYRPPGR